ncbi:hypothetical protein GQ53DRAFT_781567 [Thozetella sp. PMI_491]|nr:hypothetical protein GQ53DRAFT_781567 [Thozetella sp. PMI_491]
MSNTATPTSGSPARCRDVEVVPRTQPVTSSPKRYARLQRTTSSRLSQADALPTPFPSDPVPSADVPSSGTPSTVLYLAYGSNLAAGVFQGTRGVQPLSAIPVSVPSLDLAFDLPGIPYGEPCFANAALRKIPKPPVPIPDPPKLPPEIPDLPNPPVKPPQWQALPSTPVNDAVERNAAGDPVWRKGMIGVVYEVSREDYATIIRTEGGGSSYVDIMVPCIPLPPRMHVPEKPPIPDLPRPFLAHTLALPRLPDDPRDPTIRDGDDDGDEPEKPHPKLPSWARALVLPVRRPEPDYAQASARYLGLIIEGAKEHELPNDYQAYLNALRPYTITTRAQEIGRLLFLALWLPFVLIIIQLNKLTADPKTGQATPWMMATSNVVFNLAWLSYDYVIKPLCGDGERTQEEKDETADSRHETNRRRRRCGWNRREDGIDEEKRCLI